MKQFSVVVFILCCHFCSFSQQSQLIGRVITLNGAPVGGAKVAFNDTAKSLLTDSAGSFFCSGPIGTSYTINVTKQGFIGRQRKVTLTAANQVLTINLVASGYQLDDIIIKDRKIEDKKKEESLHVEVVNAKFIQRNLGGSLMKTLDRLPGVKTIGIGSGQSKPMIRGLGFNRVAVVDNGIKHEGQQWGADHGLELDQFAAGEVEILKGAASFMYGSDAIAGIINVKPARVPAKNAMGGSVDLIGKTNNNLLGTSADLFGRTERFFFDARFTYQRYGDYRIPTDRVYVYDFEVPLTNNYLRNTAGKESGLHLRTGIIGEHFNSIFYLSRVYNKSGFFANAHGLEPRNVDAAFHDRSNRDVQLPSQQVNHFKLINTTNYQFDNHRMELDLGFQRNFRQEYNHYVNHGFMPAVYPDNLGIPINLEREFDKTVYSANLRDKFSVGKHQFTIGGNLETQNNLINGWTFLVPAFKQFTSGAFIYDRLKLSETVIVHGAVRYDYGKVTLKKYTDWFESSVDDETATLSERLVRANDLDRNFNSLVWSVGINYNPEKLIFKANVGKSFRMPIAKELGANGVNYHYYSYEKGNPALSPEQSYQADATIGWKEKNWSLQISPFYNYFPNYIYLNPTSYYDYFYGAGNQVFEYAQSRVGRYGGELQFNYKISRWLSTEVLAEYLYSRQLSGAKKGFTLPFSPPPSILLNLNYTPADGTILKDSYFSVDYRITARQDHIVPPEKKTAGYNLINLQAGTTISLYHQPILISLQAQNLLNKKYMNHTSFYRLIELPEAGRNIILSLKIPFQIKHHQN